MFNVIVLVQVGKPYSSVRNVIELGMKEICHLHSDQLVLQNHERGTESSLWDILVQFSHFKAEETKA